jgi:DNA-binding CsgD family transcriptional regulator
MSLASPLAHIRQLCSLDVGSRLIVPAVMAALKSFVPHSLGAFFWADAEGKIFATSTSEPGTQIRAGHWATKFARRPRGTKSWPSFAELIQGRRTCVVDFAACERDFLRCDLYRKLLRPAGVSRLVASPVIAASGRTGILALLRSGYDRPFGQEDSRRLTQVLPELATALDQRHGEHEFVDDDDGDGLLIADLDGKLRHTCARGRELLHMAACPDELHRNALRAAEIDLLTRIACLSHRPGNRNDAVAAPPIAIENEWGRFQLRGSLLRAGADGADKVGIRIRRSIPAALKMARMVDGFRLSPRQRQLALLLGCSLHNDTIADRLGLRPSTVATMVKDVYERIGVNSRQALRELLLRAA